MNRSRFVSSVDHPKRFVDHSVKHIEDVVSSDTKKSVYPFGMQREIQQVTARQLVCQFDAVLSVGRIAPKASMKSVTGISSSFSGTRKSS